MAECAPALIIPAFNEAENVPPLGRELAALDLNLQVILVDDGSSDQTANEAEALGWQVVRHGTNQGIGPAVRSGIQKALELGVDTIVRMDADGQHPPEGIQCLLDVLVAQPDLDFVVASRYLGEKDYTCTPLRRLGTALLSAAMRLVCQRSITDPTSGFFACRLPVAQHFAAHYPKAWPETEALIQLYRHGYKGTECPIPFRPRQQGHSSIYGWRNGAYVGHTLWTLFTVPLRNVPYLSK